MKSILTDISNLAIVRVGSRVVAIATGWFVAYILGPERLGLLALPNLLISMSQFLTFGLADALISEIPRLKSLKASSIADTVQTAFKASVLLNIVIVAALILAWRFNADFISNDWILFTLAVMCFAGSHLFKFLYCELTGNQKFSILARTQFLLILIRSLSIIVLIFILPQDYKLYGYLGGVFIAFAVIDSFLIKNRARRESSRFILKKLWPVLRVGFPISIAMMLTVLIITGDRYQMVKILSGAVLGIYEQSVQLREALLILPSVLYTVLIPHYSSKQDSVTLSATVFRQNLLVGAFSPIFLALGVIHLPWILNIILPDYYSGLYLYQLTVMSVAPVFLSYIPVSYIISRGKTLSILLVAAITFIAIQVSDYMLGQNTTEMQTAIAAALNAGVAYWFYSLMLVIILLMSVKQSMSTKLGSLFDLYGGSIWLIILLIFWIWSGDPAQSADSVIFSGGFASALGLSLKFILAYSVWLVIFDLRTKRIRTLLKALRK
jgi:O-antigen/teichoic acid export membrane protein